MSATDKEMSNLSHENILRHIHNEVDASITTNGFLVSKVGRKIEFVYSTTNVTDDTMTVTFKEGTNTLYVYELIFIDGTRNDLISAERIS